MSGIAPFLVERWFAEFEFNVTHNIAESCIQPLTVAEIAAICGLNVESLIGNEPVGYVDAAGSRELRERIASLYPETAISNVLVTSGAIEANYLVHSALVGPGDIVVCQWPVYQQLYEVARARGAEVRFWKLRRENSFHPDVEELKKLVTGPVRLIVVNNPHNPTGALLSVQEMQQVVDIACSVGAVVHVDEVYSGIFYGEPVPSARTIHPGVVVTSSMSKVYGLPGARIGWIAGPEHIVNRCAELRDYTSICPAIVSERLSVAVLDNRAAFLERSMRLARHNLELVRSFMARLAPLVSWVPPEAGVVCFPWYSVDVPSDEFCRNLALRGDVLLIPGTCFQHTHHFRLGFGYSSDKLRRGLEILERFLRCSQSTS